MHGHEAELLTTTFLLLSAIGCGLVLKLVKQPPLVGYILAGQLRLPLVVCLTNMDNYFAINNASGGRTTCNVQSAHSKMSKTR